MKKKTMGILAVGAGVIALVLLAVFLLPKQAVPLASFSPLGIVALGDEAKTETAAAKVLKDAFFDTDKKAPEIRFAAVKLGKTADYPSYYDNAFAVSNKDKLVLDTTSLYYNVTTAGSKDLTRIIEPYFLNLLEMRRLSLEKNKPFWTLLSAQRMKGSDIQTATTLSFQAFASLGTGASAIAWQGFYGDAYSPVDEDGDITQTYFWLQDVNRRYKVLSKKMKDMTLQTVYFGYSTSKELPQLSENSTVLSAITYDNKAHGTRSVPLMISEWKDKDGALYLFILNLSTGETVRPQFRFRSNMGIDKEKLFSVSQASGTEVPILDVTNIQITAGSAELIKVLAPIAS